MSIVTVFCVRTSAVRDIHYNASNVRIILVYHAEGHRITCDMVSQAILYRYMVSAATCNKSPNKHAHARNQPTVIHVSVFYYLDVVDRFTTTGLHSLSVPSLGEHHGCSCHFSSGLTSHPERTPFSQLPHRVRLRHMWRHRVVRNISDIFATLTITIRSSNWGER